MRDDAHVSRRTAFSGLILGGLVLAAGNVAVATTEPPAAAAFEIPADRFEALDAAGMGWMFDDVEYPEQPEGVAWPTDEWPVGDLPAGVDDDALRAAFDTAFAPRDGTGGVEAIVVVQGRRLVVEQYNNWEADEPHLSWSMAKSITQAMLGILVSEGRIDVFAPAPVPEWSEPDDPRHAITTADLLHMRSGLEWSTTLRSFNRARSTSGWATDSWSPSRTRRVTPSSTRRWRSSVSIVDRTMSGRVTESGYVRLGTSNVFPFAGLPSGV